ncbi:hypothetical protein C7T35_28120 [Variovorax sp. WS11]|uniref:hypothetical protein n=1 Tax=Variovorax sp. WS11 TaxID=1105204 RepID=UPI000D0CFAAF|nr:hypothetical protein [Variovorax sp. WS11]NDZ17100.1 hypothetical protein [Variovorax sp. WS11]PSL81287.1 hypothetical protein C7T35_28120 [Variovorax sp. WS11]
MTSHPSPAIAEKPFQRVGRADPPHRSARRPPAWFALLVLGFHVLASPLLRGRRHRQSAAASQAEAAHELDEVAWPVPLTTKSMRQAPGDWLFPSLFLCMAIAALPLMGARWTMPEGMATWNAFADALVFSLPVIVPLPFLFLGCVGMLVFKPASRTSTACGFLSASMLLGLAGIYALAIGP